MNKNAQETKTINKPVMMLREEFTMNMSNLINNSGLPLFIVEPIMRDMLMEINMAVKKRYEVEKAQYEQAVMNQMEDNDDFKNGEEDDV